MTPRSALPPAVVLSIALIASWALHVPVYVGLGLLSKLMEIDAPPVAPPPMEIEIVTTENPESPPPGEEDEEPPPLDPPRAEAPAEPEPVAAPGPEPEPAPPNLSIASRPAPPPPPQRATENLRSVEHRSQNPDVEPPPDAQHLAAENSRVEEETMARIRNPNLNDPDPQPATPTEASTEPEEGDAAEEEMAELRESEGTDERDPTPEETVQPRRRPTARPSVSRTPSVAEAAPGEGRRGGAEEAAPPRRAAGGGARTRGGGEAAGMTEIVVNDGNGSFTVRVRRRPEGDGEGDEGGERVAGRGTGDEGEEGRASGRAGWGRRRARGGSARGRGAPNLRLSWADFASLYGEEELERERDLAIAQRRSRTRGASRQERWRRFRAAIENYDVRVRPGNQTALNTRADPFASYIAAMHRRIHQRFALGYLTNVPSSVDESFRGNPNMHANLELGIDAEGRVDHVSVVATSGDILFDLGAFEAVMGSQPFPAPPSQIRSPDGLVYMQWGFFRNQRQCGTFNARAYILASAPTPRDDHDALDLHPDVPPRGATD